MKSTVRADLLEILPKSERKTERLAQVVSLCKLTELLDRHPYDLSGGEQQRAALAKILLLNPDVLLLDEPTKGLDAEFKQVFGQILRTLQASGVAILMVSHDIEFCAKYADRCALFFDGNIVTESTPKTFFSGNSFSHDGCGTALRAMCCQMRSRRRTSLLPAAVRSNRRRLYRNISASRPHRRRRRGR